MFVVNDSQSVALYGLIVEPLKEFTVMVKIGLERVTCFFSVDLVPVDLST